MVTEVDCEIDHSAAGITGAEGTAKCRRETIASGDRDGLCDRESKSAGSGYYAGTTHECLKVAETGTCRGVQAGRSQTSERDHKRVAHATQKRYGVSAAAGATCTREST